MHFTGFTIMQDGQAIGSFTVKDLAIGTAKRHAVNTGRPVSVLAHIDGGGTREVIFNPDGTNEKIWLIDKGKPLSPAPGQVYRHCSRS